ncbi:hypothetical protein A6R68_02576 [Neotoma lepida]|uniref:Uncharacterized protein n=1 Tax=Neotoma lepida TaxID=56216 RepID=A0A1A6GTA2_NEOLE|nr:hypothetical protein A6R68_02576 [Neotoma lepida]
MKVLENRTKDLKLEMEVLENLQELKDLNQSSGDSSRKRNTTAALLEEARHSRLLEDSNTEDEAPPYQPQAAARLNPTAICN